ncbi:MAG: hypothetical protein WC716_11795 [Chitinophagaceae bacterium]|jgi:hypothetical protein
MNHKQAPGVIMHKPLWITFDISSPNGEAPAQPIKELSANRFKPSFSSAPISRRNDRKRKKLLEKPI